MQPLKHTNSMKFQICSCWKKMQNWNTCHSQFFTPLECLFIKNLG